MSAPIRGHAYRPDRIVIPACECGWLGPVSNEEAAARALHDEHKRRVHNRRPQQVVIDMSGVPVVQLTALSDAIADHPARGRRRVRRHLRSIPGSDGGQK